MHSQYFKFHLALIWKVVRPMTFKKQAKLH